MCAGVGSGGGFQKFRRLPEFQKVRKKIRRVRACAGVGSGSRVSGGFRFACWFRFWRQVPEGSGEFRRVPGHAGVGSGGKFRKVSEGSGEFRRVLV